MARVKSFFCGLRRKLGDRSGKVDGKVWTGVEGGKRDRCVGEGKEAWWLEGSQGWRCGGMVGRPGTPFGGETVRWW